METIWKIQNALGVDVMNSAQKCGTNASKMVKSLLKVIYVLEGLQQAEHLRMLNMYGLQSTKIGADSVRTRS